MNILVPVDFSKCAGNALNYASVLAELSGARLLLHHVYTEEEGLDKAKTNELKQSLAVFYTGYGNRYKEVDVDVLESPDLTGLAYHQPIKKADYVVMGTKGAGALKSALVGSNTVRLMDKITNPMLVVPEGARPPQKNGTILLLADYVPTENFEVFDPLIRLARLLNAEVKILNIKKHNQRYEIYEVVEKNRLEQYLENKITFTRERSFNGDVESGMNTYLRDHSVQLICMVYHEHSALDNLFKRNHTHEMAFHSTIPLLILNKRSVYNKN